MWSVGQSTVFHNVTAHLTFRTHPSGPESRVRNRGSGIFPDPGKTPLNQEFLPKPILLAQNLELGEIWGKNDGFKGKFLVLENFLGSGKIPDPRFQTQIPDPMVGSGMSDGQSHYGKIVGNISRSKSATVQNSFRRNNFLVAKFITM